MEIIKVTGKTLDEAIQSAKSSLDCSLDQMDYKVLEEGTRGILGFGAKPYVIEASRKEEPLTDKVKKFVRVVLDEMGLMAEVKVHEEEENICVNLTGPKMGLIIGYRGETLDALQYLTNLAINRERSREEYTRIIIDTEGYRKKREETLKRLAEKTAWKVNKYGKSIKLDAMNPYERRIIHFKLQDYPDVTTYSEGQEPYRKVVVAPEK
ncbi:MAG: protein jag [Clostridium sp.]|jgi:spoIIIJ-associated protein|nr:protein jag [Clostridium sp.]